MTSIDQIYIFEMDREADAVLSNGYTVSMNYVSAENEFTKMFNNPEKYDTCDIIKLNRRG